MDKIKKSGIILTILLLSLSGIAQDISGSWNGILEVNGNQIRLIFNISQTDNGFISTMDSPDQGAKDIPVSSTIFENEILKIELPNAGIKYEGILNKENVFIGTFKQSGQSFPLNLKQEKIEKEKVIRPQEPIRPYSYYSEDVKFENKKDNIVLAGTLTLPAKDGNYPVVILISGSGPQNRDEEILGHKPFLVLSDHLTKNGIAVLRFDDRGTFESTGIFKGATSFDFANDVMSAIEYLKTRKEIDKNKIGLAGHSEGGIIAPLVATKSNDVNFIVLMAGTGIRGDQLLLLQQELVGKASGMSNEDVSEEKKINKGAFDLILRINDRDSLKTELINYFGQIIKDSPESERPEGLSEEEYLNLIVNQFIGPWMVNFIQYDPSITLENVKCPVLAINGEKDLQVPSKVNLNAIKEALEKAGNKDVTIIELPNLNHLLQECETGSPDEYARIDQTISPIALDEITKWILKHIK